MPRRGLQTPAMDYSPEKTLAANVQWVLENTVLDSQAKLGKRAGFDQKTVSRILAATNAPTLDKVAGLARALRVHPWQMLAPQFGTKLYTIDAALKIVPIQGPQVEMQPAARSKPQALAA